MKQSFTMDSGNLYCLILVENDLEKKILQHVIPGLVNAVNEIIVSINPKLKNGETLNIKNLTVKDIVPDAILQQTQTPIKKK